MEDTRERLKRYLDDAWAVEKSLPITYGDMAKEISDPQLKVLFETLGHNAERHHMTLEAHIKSMGETPSGGKSLFNQVVAKAIDVLQAAHDEYDKSVINLMKAYTMTSFEASIYEAMRAYAEAIGAEETARMARMHRDEDEELAKQIWPMIATISGRVRVPVAA